MTDKNIRYTCINNIYDITIYINIGRDRNRNDEFLCWNGTWMEQDWKNMYKPLKKQVENTLSRVMNTFFLNSSVDMS